MTEQLGSAQHTGFPGILLLLSCTTVFSYLFFSVIKFILYVIILLKFVNFFSVFYFLGS